MAAGYAFPIFSPNPPTPAVGVPEQIIVSMSFDFLFPLNHGFHTVIHILDKLNFRQTKASLV